MYLFDLGPPNRPKPPKDGAASKLKPSRNLPTVSPSLRVALLTEYRFVEDPNFGFEDVVSTTTYTATGLTTGREYYFRVSARNTIGYSGFCELAGNTCTGDQVMTTIA